MPPTPSSFPTSAGSGNSGQRLPMSPISGPADGRSSGRSWSCCTNTRPALRHVLPPSTQMLSLMPGARPAPHARWRGCCRPRVDHWPPAHATWCSSPPRRPGRRRGAPHRRGFRPGTRLDRPTRKRVGRAAIPARRRPMRTRSLLGPHRMPSDGLTRDEPFATIIYARRLVRASGTVRSSGSAGPGRWLSSTTRVSRTGPWSIPGPEARRRPHLAGHTAA